MQRAFDNVDLFQPTSVFVGTWDRVGGNNTDTDKVNKLCQCAYTNAHGDIVHYCKFALHLLAYINSLFIVEM